MSRQFILQWLSLSAIFIIALVLELAPWPLGLQHFKPAWLVLVLIYWALYLPQKISIGWGFLLGLVWDMILGSTLGIRALVLSLIAYAIAANYQRLRNLSLWQQSLFILLGIFAVRLGIFTLEWLVHTAEFYWQDIFGAIISALLWPWLYLLFRAIGHKLQF